ncbi:MAG TPA: hypothetical protein VH593_27325 [Ktedonobacteraceae bacterium]|jgi:hypothetical protein
MEAGVASSAGWYAFINDIMGMAYIGWFLSVGISLRVKSKFSTPMLRERELKKAE